VVVTETGDISSAGFTAVEIRLSGSTSVLEAGVYELAPVGQKDLVKAA
jgi:hypothetical protein